MSDYSITEICFSVCIIVLVVCITIYNCVRVRAENQCNRCEEDDDADDNEPV